MRWAPPGTAGKPTVFFAEGFSRREPISRPNYDSQKTLGVRSRCRECHTIPQCADFLS
jgi:hypothetical protein